MAMSQYSDHSQKSDKLNPYGSENSVFALVDNNPNISCCWAAVGGGRGDCFSNPAAI